MVNRRTQVTNVVIRNRPNSNNNSNRNRRRNARRRRIVNGFVVRNPFNSNVIRRRLLSRNRGPSSFNAFRNQDSGPTNTNRNMSNYFSANRVNAPVGVGYNVENRQRTSIVVSRTGFVHALEASETFKIMSFAMHPTLLPWVKTLSSLYNKYMFSRFSMRYVGQCPATSGGYAFVAYDYDPHVALAGNIWRAQAYDKFVMCPVWSTSTWVSVTPNILTDKWYDNELGTDATVPSFNMDSWHDKYPGRIVIGTNGANSISRDATVGQIEISYTLHLSRPSFVGAEDPPTEDKPPKTVTFETIDETHVIPLDANSDFSDIIGV